ncbi:MAG: ParA family protein [Pseudomonadota bacterium]|nr:ParA family protein [Pseudomonadota bacterium]
MTTILVANSKGGCGKTTVATHLAVAFAKAGHATALIDTDRQRAALAWGKRRNESCAPVTLIDWTKQAVPLQKSRFSRLIIDVPAGIKRTNMAELVDLADHIVIPVSPSMFDETGTLRFLKRLEDLKPIRKSRKTVILVGNRVRRNTHAAARLERFLASLGHNVPARIRDSQLYPDYAIGGGTVFDGNNRRTRAHRDDWLPLLTFIEDGAI